MGKRKSNSDRTASDSARLKRLCLQGERVESVAHNIKSILSLMAGHSQFLKRTYPNEIRCEQIAHGVQRITELVDQFCGKGDEYAPLEWMVNRVARQFNAMCTGMDRINVVVRNTGPTLEPKASNILEAILLHSLDNASSRNRREVCVIIEDNPLRIISHELHSGCVPPALLAAAEANGLSVGEAGEFVITPDPSAILSPVADGLDTE